MLKLNGPVLDPAWRVDDVDLEEIVLAYLRHENGPPLEVVGGVR
jgi:hypothetical protein